jgi:hypothetical protein
VRVTNYSLKGNIIPKLNTVENNTQYYGYLGWKIKINPSPTTLIKTCGNNMMEIL